MIFLDTDGVLIDFIGAAAKFGIRVEPNNFSTWHWKTDDFCSKCREEYGSAYCIFPKPEHFYAEADLQPWVERLLEAVDNTKQYPEITTKDYSEIKQNFLLMKLPSIIWSGWVSEAPDKTALCKKPTDLLIDDNASECEAWRKKGGIAYHFDLAHPDQFGEFLKWWRLEK